jgi:hypothetical protein
MEAILASNRGLADMPWAMPVDEGEVAEATPREAAPALASGETWLHDEREP